MLPKSTIVNASVLGQAVVRAVPLAAALAVGPLARPWHGWAYALARFVADACEPQVEQETPKLLDRAAAGLLLAAELASVLAPGPAVPAAVFAGLALACVSLALRHWSLRLVQSGSLVRHGPYAIVAHPASWALAGSAAGLALACLSWAGAVLLLVWLPVLAATLRREEAELARRWEGYGEYLTQLPLRRGRRLADG